MTENPKALTQIGTIFLTWRRYLQRELVPHNITLKQHFVLRQLTREEFLYPSRIAELLYCDRPTATVVINNMEKQAWIRKEKDSENRKQVKISITEEGRALMTHLETQVPKDVNGFNPLSCFTEEERVQLEKLLSKWQKHIKTIE